MPAIMSLTKKSSFKWTFIDVSAESKPTWRSRELGKGGWSPGTNHDDCSGLRDNLESSRKALFEMQPSAAHVPAPFRGHNKQLPPCILFLFIGCLTKSFKQEKVPSSVGLAAIAQTAPPRASVRCLGLLASKSHSVNEPSRPPLKRRHKRVVGSWSHARLVIAMSRCPTSVCTIRKVFSPTERRSRYNENLRMTFHDYMKPGFFVPMNFWMHCTRLGTRLGTRRARHTTPRVQ